MYKFSLSESELKKCTVWHYILLHLLSGKASLDSHHKIQGHSLINFIIFD